jgi:hypothetical protein
MADPDIPEDPTNQPDQPGEGPGTVGFVADVVRKAVLTGVGALFLTEEGARKVAREWKLPKDLATYLVSQASGAKDEVLRVLGQELRRLLDSETLTIEIHAEMRLKASDGEPTPPVKVRVKRRARTGGDEDTGE